MQQHALYLTVQDAWAAMLREIARAEHTVDIEHFIFKDGGIGEKIVDLLEKKARAGLRVRLLLDGVGSAELMAQRLSARCSAAGITLRFFNPLLPTSLGHHTTLFFRDHQKLIVIDGRLGLTGGVCVDERMREWRDNLLVLTGAPVAHMQLAFEHMWAKARNEGSRSFRTPSSTTRYLFDTPLSPRRPAYKEMRSAIRNAKARLLLETPYFVPPHRLLRLIRGAARRGVAVSLVLPARSDATVADLAAESYFSKLLEVGVRIYRYERTTMHAKAYVADDTWAMLGSHNLDRLSFQYNFEGSIVTSDPTLVSDIARSIAGDIAHARELTKAVWAHRGFLQRLKEVLVWPMRFFL